MRLNYELFRSHARASYMMIDWKRFDKFLHFSVIDDLFVVIRRYLNFSQGYIPTSDYPDTETNWTSLKSRRLERLWQWSIDAFHQTPVVLPNGEMYSRNFAGLPSGLYATQYLDSMYNYLMIVTTLLELCVFTPNMMIKIMGDDSLAKLELFIPPSEHSNFPLDVKQTALSIFNSTISVEKSKITNCLNGVEILSYTNHNGLPHRDPISLLAQFYHTKARNPTPSKTMASAIGFAYASCGFDEQLYRVCRDIFTLYKNQGFSPDPTGLYLALGEDPFGLHLNIDLDDFPSKSYIQAKLTCLDYQTSTEWFWNTEHFLAEW
nr:MAG: RNA dependent RNA polymerase [Kalajoki alphapartitivirus]